MTLPTPPPTDGNEWGNVRVGKAQTERLAMRTPTGRVDYRTRSDTWHGNAPAVVAATFQTQWEGIEQTAEKMLALMGEYGMMVGPHAEQARGWALSILGAAS